MKQLDKKNESQQLILNEDLAPSYSWSKFFIQVVNILAFLALIAKIVAIKIAYS